MQYSNFYLYTNPNIFLASNCTYTPFIKKTLDRNMGLYKTSNPLTTYVKSKLPLSGIEKFSCVNYLDLVIGRSWSSYACAFELFAPVAKVLMIRGIGYRTYVVYNDSVNQEAKHNSFIYNIWYRYILVRSGQSYPTYIPVYNGIGIRKKRKGRKLIVYGFNRKTVSSMIEMIHGLRKPNVFTGRGVRKKGFKYRRKAGKRASRVW